MEDESRRLLFRLRGAHSVDSRGRVWNWCAIWLFSVVPGLFVGLGEAYVRGWETFQFTPLTYSACVLSGVVGGAYIRAFNRSHYVVENTSVSRVATWPLYSWIIATHEIQHATLVPGRGPNWVLVLRLRKGWRKKIVLTKSMREALGFP